MGIPQKLKIESLFGLGVPLLQIFLKELYIILHWSMHTHVYGSPIHNEPDLGNGLCAE